MVVRCTSISAVDSEKVYRQLVGALFIIGWNVVWTSLIMLFIKHVLRIPLRMSDDVLLIGDDAIHGEAAYSLADDLEMGDLDTPTPDDSGSEQK